MKLLLRADAGPSIGVGHLARMTALAEEARARGHDVVIASTETVDLFDRRLRAGGVVASPLDVVAGSIADAAATRTLATAFGADVVVADGYTLGPAFVAEVRAIAPVVVVDDTDGGRPLVCDGVLNQNLHARADLYDEVDGPVLAGVDFALLRREFRAARDRRAHRPVAHGRVVLLTGGTDPEDVGSALVRETEARWPGPARFVTTSANPNLNELPGNAVDIVVDSPDLSEHLEWADVAVSAAGSTTWELCCLGVPTVLVSLADNQDPIAATLDEAGVALSAGRASPDAARRALDAILALAGDADRCRMLAEAGRTLVDGRGAVRVCEALEEGFG